jgi:hypothetical protein
MLWESPLSAGVAVPLGLTELESLSRSVVSLVGEVGVSIETQGKATG